MMSPDASSQAMVERYLAVRERLRTAALNAGRKPEDVRLVAVSKFHPAASVAVVAAAGQVHFGENYVQEALKKQDDLRHLDLCWHFIGHLQSNKAREVAGRFALVHTVDSLKLAQELSRRMETHAPRRADDGVAVQDILLQVNIGEEEQKSGIDRQSLFALADAVVALPNLRLQGLMGMPPFFDDGERARPYFAALRELHQALCTRLAVALPHLSMGMSGDCVQAVEEGATIVRIGTDIFGARPARI